MKMELRRRLHVSKQKHLNSQRGGAAVEFALLLPLILLLLIGIVELGLALYDKAVITNASREAARAGIVYKVPQLTATQIQSVATNYAQGRLITFGGTVAPTVNVDQGSGTSSGSPLTVTVSYSFTGLLLKSSFNPLSKVLQMSASTTMNYE
ncbi:TadE/TadG family type IV pilus assembly protein [Burkholderia sp. MSMB1498]|uniref:TadE/TadG family type IV pilus assembly protein n=1 Tax=Burkholderia sp. MSMB1498 TaxID=1637842 RepID=UPI000B17E9EC|nr:TadE/TadG family type IV pilus assembly protein [Burkholderia sp. MSMB1498]